MYICVSECICLYLSGVESAAFRNKALYLFFLTHLYVFFFLLLSIVEATDHISMGRNRDCFVEKPKFLCFSGKRKIYRGDATASGSSRMNGKRG